MLPVTGGKWSENLMNTFPSSLHPPQSQKAGWALAPGSQPGDPPIASLHSMTSVATDSEES